MRINRSGFVQAVARRFFAEDVSGVVCLWAFGLFAGILSAAPARAAAPLSLDRTGELGSFSQYGGRTYQWSNIYGTPYPLPKSPIYLYTDTGLIWNRWTDPNGNSHAEQLTSVPARVVNVDGRNVRVFDFTDFVLPSGFILVPEGALPCAITTTGNATISGEVHVYASRHSGGIISNYGDSWGYPGQGPSPGQVGLGPGHDNSDYDFCHPPGAGGGGMGGAGASGQTTHGYYRDYDDYEYHAQSLLGGLGGGRVATWSFQGGSGGASGCGYYWGRSGFNGGTGGGAVWFDIGGNLNLDSSAYIWAAGDPGMSKYENRQGGGGGGGSGGYIGLNVAGVLTNGGTLNASGGAGTQVGGDICYSAGGSGGGGKLYLGASAIANTGTLNVAGGGGEMPAPEPGTIYASVPIQGPGTVIGTVVFTSNVSVLPRDLPGLKLWLDGSDVNANGSNPLDGSNVGLWADKSGLGNHAGAAPAAHQPTYSASTIGGCGFRKF